MVGKRRERKRRFFFLYIYVSWVEALSGQETLSDVTERGGRGVVKFREWGIEGFGFYGSRPFFVFLWSQEDVC